MSLVLVDETGVSGGEGEGRPSGSSRMGRGECDICLDLTLKRGLLFPMDQRMGSEWGSCVDFVSVAE